jgi:hypothetical protein
LNATTGQYQLYDNSSNPLQAFPIFGHSADDIGIAPETRYQETGAIKFDLAKTALPAIPTTGQICFQGVRRMKGNPARNPNYKARPKTFIYDQLTAPVNPPIGSYVRVWQPVTDYDFELYQIILLVQEASSGPSTFNYVAESGGVTCTNIGGGSVTLNISFGAPSITVVGTTITIVDGTEAGATISAFLARWAAVPAATALLSATLAPGTGTPATTPFYAGPVVAQILSPSSIGAGNFNALTTPISSLWLYDSNKVQVSSAPMVDIYMDGGPQGVYRNGAIVTPLWYPQNSQIQIDVYSQLASGGATLAIYLVGRQWIPC